MDQKELFESLDKIPKIEKAVDGLLKSVAANNKVATDSVQSISKDVGEIVNCVEGLETRLSNLETKVSTATAKMQKEVTINYPPLPAYQVKPTDVRVYATHSDNEINTIAEKIADKVDKKKKTSNFVENAALIITVLAIGVVLFTYIKNNNDYRSWMDRAITVGELAGDKHPGDRAVELRNEFKKGYKARRAKRAEIRSLEEKFDQYWKNNTRVLREVISNLVQENVEVLDYSLADVDSTSYNALVRFRLQNSDKEMRAHICKNGDVYVTADEDINTVQEADKYFKRKSWKYLGNRIKD